MCSVEASWLAPDRLSAWGISVMSWYLQSLPSAISRAAPDTGQATGEVMRKCVKNSARVSRQSPWQISASALLWHLLIVDARGRNPWSVSCVKIIVGMMSQTDQYFPLVHNKINKHKQCRHQDAFYSFYKHLHWLHSTWGLSPSHHSKLRCIGNLIWLRTTIIRALSVIQHV